jgi:hypothetical protein
MSPVREAAPQSKLHLVTSPLCLLEVVGVFVREQLQTFASMELGISAVEKRGSKTVGDLLLKLSMIARGEEPAPKGESQDTFNELWSAIAVDFNMAGPHELHGILLAGIPNFTLGIDAQETAPADLAYLQLGGADIMHVLFAHHLGCTHFVSFDHDFRRAREVLQRAFALTLLSSPDELLRALRTS